MKEDYAEKICELTRQILNEEKLVKSNFVKNLLMEKPKNANNVLVMGINPGDRKKNVEEEEMKNSILFLENLTDEEKEELRIFNDLYIFTDGYHKANYKLFERIHAKAHWTMDGYLKKDEIEKMIKNAEKANSGSYEGKRQKVIDTIRKMQEKEREKSKGKYKKDVYVLFEDLLWYHDSKQENVEKAINEENKNENIKRIIELNIEYYNPKLIVITNAKASRLVEEALQNENKNIDREHKDVLICKNTPIILGGMVSSGRMDKFSQERLKERIEEFYKE